MLNEGLLFHEPFLFANESPSVPEDLDYSKVKKNADEDICTFGII